MGICALYLTDKNNGPLIQVSEWETRNTWHSIVRTHSGGQEGLFLYDRVEGNAEFWTLEDRPHSARQVRKVVPASEMFPLIDLVVAGSLSPDYKQDNGLLFYRKAGGFGAVVTVDDSLEFRTLRDFKDWRDSWDSIVIGPGSQILFSDSANRVVQICQYRYEEYPYLIETRTLDRIGYLFTHAVYIPSTWSSGDSYTLLYTRAPEAPGSGSGQVREGFGGEFLGNLGVSALNQDWDLFVPGVFQSTASRRETWDYFAYSSAAEVIRLHTIASGGQIIPGENRQDHVVGGDWTHIVRGQWVRRPDCCDCLLFYKP